MDRKLKVLLVEDDLAECNAFGNYVDSTCDISVIEVTNNADQALEHVINHLPDAVVLDLELHYGGGNGISFLEMLNSTELLKKPYILVTTNNISRITHDQVRLLGADFIMVKSQSDYSAKTVIEFLRSLKDVILSSKTSFQPEQHELLSPNELIKERKTRVSALLDELGFSPAMKGRGYLVDSMVLLVEGQNYYVKEIAQKNSKTEASVIRAMENAIEKTWRTGEIETLHRCYTAKIHSNKAMPTLHEFVCHFADKIRG